MSRRRRHRRHRATSGLRLEAAGALAEQAGTPDLAALGRVEAVQREQAQRQRAEILLANGAELSGQLTLSSLLELIPRRAAELVRASSGALLLWDEAAGSLVPAAWHGAEGDGDGDGDGAPARTIAGLAAASAAAGGAVTPDALAAPILYDDRLVGAIAVGRPSECPPFAQPDLELLQAFAVQAGIAVERTRFLERAAAARAARELARLKTEFLTTVSHELRTPLSLIHGYAELLMHRGDALSADEVRLMSGEIYAASRTLARLVSDLLDFSRLDREPGALQRQAVDIGVLLHEVADAVRDQPTGARVLVDAPPALFADGDPERLRQVVGNLLANALTYAPDGPIVLRAEQTDGVIRIEVEDRGPGIPPEEQARVWESFYRGAITVRLHTRGAGLGLAVVKRLVELHGGQVGVSTTPGVGSIFWLTLPCWAFPSPDPAPLRRQPADDAPSHGPDAEAAAPRAPDTRPMPADSSKLPGRARSRADERAREADTEDVLAHDEAPG